MLLCLPQPVMSSQARRCPGGVACRCCPARDLPQHPRTLSLGHYFGGRARGGHPATVGRAHLGLVRSVRALPVGGPPRAGRPRWATIAARRAPIPHQIRSAMTIRARSV